MVDYLPLNNSSSITFADSFTEKGQLRPLETILTDKDDLLSS